ncbi:SAF domain protein [Kribbella flavida DSM 17836]|uniref:SAF domain protein n=1 Tax=Kribbella flavida (strain DSM 17836 / JCM 10339 / NBRC 14399) TaxID=479435 RepID=D2PQ77_KRIFD|nr:SAF domain-containing protein [Kribbella flavida]ADB34779.1 SAF domain protein [Kribbella flavida DSM 17836]
MTNSFLHDLVRAARWHRRLLAGLFAAAAVYFALVAVSPPPAASTPVLAAARDLPGGLTPAAGDIRTLRLPTSTVPAGVLPPGTDLSHRVLATAVRSGEPLTDARFLTPTAVPPGLLAYPLRLDDADIAALLRPGDRIDLYAASATADASATRLAEAVPILALPAPTRSTGALVVLAASPGTAARLAQASANTRLTVALTPDTS